MILFDPEFLERLEHLSLVSRRVYRGELMAARRSRRPGSGIEFIAHREYTPGDDFRHLDWNLYARHGELLLKRFHEETDLHVYLLLDMSRSMEAGNPSKFDVARRIVAALAYMALADLDRVSVIAFADRIHDVFPLSRGKTCILRLMQFLTRLTPTGEHTNLFSVAREFTTRLQRPGLAIVVSDFYDPAGFEPGLDALRHQRYEPQVIQVHRPEEAAPVLRGDVEVIDQETGEKRRMIVDDRRRAAYMRVYAGFLDRLQAYCLRNRMSCAITQTTTTTDTLILELMRQSVIKH